MTKFRPFFLYLMKLFVTYEYIHVEPCISVISLIRPAKSANTFWTCSVNLEFRCKMFTFSLHILTFFTCPTWWKIQRSHNYFYQNSSSDISTVWRGFASKGSHETSLWIIVLYYTNRNSTYYKCNLYLATFGTENSLTFEGN